MEFLVIKSTAAAGIFIGSLLLSLVPLKLSHSKFSKSATCLGKTFAAGVFLGAAFLHLFPECIDLLSEVKYPLPGLLALISYMFMLFIEKVAFTDHQLVSHGKNHTDLGCHSDSDHSDEEEDKLKHVLSTRSRLYSHIEEGDGENCSTVCKEMLISKPLQEPSTYSAIGPSIILASALSIHSIIEGLTLGIQSEKSHFINLAIAICVHKIPESLVVGITLAETRQQLKFAMILIFCLATPFGILLGAGLGQALDQTSQGVFLGICVGTFVYIAASEIIVEEFAVSRLKYQKFISALCGISFMSVLMLIES